MFDTQHFQLIKDLKYHKNSFNCAKCPKSGCPAYFEGTFPIENENTGELKIITVEGCSFKLNPIFYLNSLTLNNKTYVSNLEIKKAIENMGNRIFTHFRKFISLIYILLGKEQPKEISSGNRSNS